MFYLQGNTTKNMQLLFIRIWVYKTDTSYLPRFQHDISTEEFSFTYWQWTLYIQFLIYRFFTKYLLNILYTKVFCSLLLVLLFDESVKPQNSHNLATAILVIFYTVCTVYRLYIGTLICFDRYIFDLNGSPVFQYFYIFNTNYN